MLKNPFAQAAQGESNLKRNAYDLSFQNLFSTHFGRLTPAMMQEVLPGDSFEIDSSLAIQGMPTVFPLQTRVRVSVEYYYCRNRCVMDDFEDFIFKTKDVEQCWLKMNSERAKKMISTGSLGDFFGLPTTYAVDTPIYGSLNLTEPAMYGKGRNSGQTSSQAFFTYINGLVSSADAIPIGTGVNDCYFFGQYTDAFTENIFDSNNIVFLSDYKTQILQIFSDPSYYIIICDDNLKPLAAPVQVTLLANLPYNQEHYKLTLTANEVFDFKAAIDNALESHPSLRLMIASIGAKPSTYDAGTSFNTFGGLVINGSFPFLYTSSQGGAIISNIDSMRFVAVSDGILDATDDLAININPFVGNTPSLKVNALPYRHYTQVCNYYHRNDKNNPYMLNGEAQYNEFIPTHATGADENEYDFCYRNWELDRFTSAVQSPQFGEAPLVGLTFSGADTAKLTFQDADDPNQTYTATLGVEDDRIIDIADFSKDIPSANLRRLQEMISYGISINDLRVTNSFQRFLENVLRRGLRYRSQLKSHFGVSVDYPDIDIPQYIGGYSGELTVGKVTSTAETSEAGLGDFNGSLSGQISSQHKIRCYCPEHGYIMCLVSLTPIPVYGQVCAKNMIKTDPFDYFLPEFGKIGFVPMHYSEVMPLQTAAGENVNDVFGYQKAWYDYMMNYDQVHSYFRTNMKDFVLQRTFAQRPELVKDFTVINPEQLSDVFVTGNISDKYDVNDKFLCNFYTHMISKRCIPRVGTPSLE